MTKAARSPLRDKPLRLPGQSVQERLFEVLYDRMMAPVLIALFLTAMAAMDWIRYYTGAPPTPRLLSAIAVIALGYAVIRVRWLWPELQQLKLGRQGERMVAEFLEPLRANGYRVFHDVGGNGFNVDHVLIGPAGVFCIETKTRSKPSGDAKLRFDGETLTVGGFEPERDPVIQVKAQVGWLRELLQQSTGKTFKVRPVILFPGWFIDHVQGANREVWVLNPKALPAFLKNEPPVLAEADVTLASYHLSRFIRAN